MINKSVCIFSVLSFTILVTSARSCAVGAKLSDLVGPMRSSHACIRSYPNFSKQASSQSSGRSPTTAMVKIRIVSS